MIEEQLRRILDDRASKGQLRIIDTYEEEDSKSDPVDFFSNDYLGITTDEGFKQQFVKEAAKDKEPIVGATGSRTTSGNSSLHAKLEKRIAEFHKVEAALLFNSGFDANYGVFSCIPQKDDVICFDELSHASLLDGIKASRASQKVKFKHSSVDDLSRIFRKLKEDEGFENGTKNVFIAIETLYSMDGDVAPIKEIAALLKEEFPRGNGYLVIDEAHATGVFGEGGRGLANELGAEASCFIQVHTFSKGLGTLGAVVLCSSTIRTYLTNFARSFRYTTALPRMNLLTISLAYDFLESEEGRRRAQAALRLGEYTRTQLSRRGFKLLCDDGMHTPIMCVSVSNPRKLSTWLHGRGYSVTPVTFPVVPKGGDRIRICVHASNTRQQVDGLLSSLEKGCSMARL